MCIRDRDCPIHDRNLIAMSKITKSIYRVLFINQGKLYELYARSIYQGELYGFIEVEESVSYTHLDVYKRQG